MGSLFDTPYPYDLVLLDRDGVLNVDLEKSVRSLGDFQMIPQGLQGVRHLSEWGILMAIVTNQAVVGRGELSFRELEEIHESMFQQIHRAGGHIDRLYVCTDTQIEPYGRRKPAPGMLLEAMTDLVVTPSRTLMIGDAMRDLEAARAAGVDAILVRTGKGTETEMALAKGGGGNATKGIRPMAVFDNLYQAVLNIFP